MTENVKNPVQTTDPGDLDVNVTEMNHTAKRIWLIRMLLREDRSYRDYRIPDSEKEQKDLLRSLLNVRPPEQVSREFLAVQDAYLGEVRDAETITEADTLPVSRVDARIALWQGDMTCLRADAIVNPANAALLGCFRPLHNCLDNLIHSKAGVELRLACNDYMTEQARLHGGQYEEPTGHAVLTPGFNLPAQYVLHTVGPIAYPFCTDENEKELASCYRACLDTASEHGIRTLAFCCISTGVFMFPQDRAAEIAVRTVRSWLDEHPETAVRKVIFNVYKDEDRRLYDALLNRKIPVGR